MSVEAGAISGQVVQEDFAASPVAGVESCAVRFWPAEVMDEQAAATATASVVGQRRHDLVGEFLIERRVSEVSRLEQV